MNRSYGSGSGTERVYVIEARSTSGEPRIIYIGEFGLNNFVLDHEWRRVPIERAAHGVPSLTWSAIASERHLLSETAALTLAYWFLADLNARMLQDICVEVRLVEIELKYDFSMEEKGVGQIINRTDGERGKFEPRETEPIPLSARHPKVSVPAAEGAQPSP